jgi:phosphatidylglycerol---prolipoprotein diacylglyceryl transferase
MTFDDYGIHIGDLLYLRYYAFILLAGAFLGAYIASLEARRRGRNPELVWDGLLWVLVGGIIGARLWHVFTPSPSQVAAGITTQFYLSNPLEILMMWRGGLGIPGAVAGGLLGLYLFARRNQLGFAEWADFAAPGVALGQAIGRWGNFVNHELYGAPTTLPWAITIPPQHRVPGFTDPALTFHPLFLYESIGNFLICLGLLYVARHYADRLKNGDVFLIYLLAYPVLRFLLEFIRLDSAEVLGINANQSFMVIVAFGAALALQQRHRRRRRYELTARSAE